MPPKRHQKTQKPSDQEGRVLLAIKAFQNREIPTITEAARRFEVPRTSLRNRINGHRNRSETRANNYKLTQLEEESLLQWTLSMDSRGSAPRPTMVAEMANILLAERCTQTVGVNWVFNYIKRYPALKTRFSRRYDYQRAQCEDPTVMRKWFDLVQRTINENGIQPDDIYNFDETGFAMGLIATAKVVTRAEYYGRRSIKQPRNREWVTSIECISSTGFKLPPTLIFKS